MTFHRLEVAIACVETGKQKEQERERTIERERDRKGETEKGLQVAKPFLKNVSKNFYRWPNQILSRSHIHRHIYIHIQNGNRKTTNNQTATPLESANTYRQTNNQTTNALHHLFFNEHNTILEYA